MSIDISGLGHLTDEELISTTYHDLNASPREMSLAIRLGDALDIIRALKDGIGEDGCDCYH